MRRLLAEIDETRGEIRSAEKHWKQALLHAPEDPAVHLEAAAFQERRGRDAKALALVREATRADPGSAEAWYQVGRLELQAGDEDRAFAALRTAVNLDTAHREAENPANLLAVELFDHQNDPYETINCADEKPELIPGLSAMLKRLL